VKSRSKRDVVVQMYEDTFYLDKFSKHECCHCALVHDVEYVVEKGRIFTRWKVNAKETAQQRKKLGIKVTRGSA
jgi:hypothetical protein